MKQPNEHSLQHHDHTQTTDTTEITEITEIIDQGDELLSLNDKKFEQQSDNNVQDQDGQHTNEHSDAPSDQSAPLIEPQNTAEHTGKKDEDTSDSPLNPPQEETPVKQERVESNVLAALVSSAWLGGSLIAVILPACILGGALSGTALSTAPAWVSPLIIAAGSVGALILPLYLLDKYKNEGKGLKAILDNKFVSAAILVGTLAVAAGATIIFCAAVAAVIGAAAVYLGPVLLGAGAALLFGAGYYHFREKHQWDITKTFPTFFSSYTKVKEEKVEENQDPTNTV